MLSIRHVRMYNLLCGMLKKVIMIILRIRFIEDLKTSLK